MVLAVVVPKLKLVVAMNVNKQEEKKWKILNRENMYINNWP